MAEIEVDTEDTLILTDKLGNKYVVRCSSITCSPVPSTLGCNTPIRTRIDIQYEGFNQEKVNDYDLGL